MIQFSRIDGKENGIMLKSNHLSNEMRTIPTVKRDNVLAG